MVSCQEGMMACRQLPRPMAALCWRVRKASASRASTLSRSGTQWWRQSLLVNIRASRGSASNSLRQFATASLRLVKGIQTSGQAKLGPSRGDPARTPNPAWLEGNSCCRRLARCPEPGPDRDEASRPIAERPRHTVSAALRIAADRRSNRRFGAQHSVTSPSRYPRIRRTTWSPSTSKQRPWLSRMRRGRHA